MAQITLKLTKEEAIVVRFLLGGAHGNPSVSPPARIAAQEVLTKVDAAIADAAAEPETIAELQSGDNEQPAQAARRRKQG